MTSFTPGAFGWCPDITDPRDFPFTQGILTKQASTHTPPSNALPNHETDPPLPAIQILDEETLQLFQRSDGPAHSTAAVMSLSLVDWISRRWRGIPMNRSSKFLYQMTIRTQGGGGVMGVGLRATLKTLVRFGAPPEPMWPSHSPSPEVPTDPMLFAFQSDFADLKFYRIDDRCRPATETLFAIKQWLASGTPCLFGFSVPDCITSQSWIPHEHDRSGILGGTAAIAMGYDDNFVVNAPQPDLRGALRVRCGWGEQWGDHGYGWLPYRYVLERWASDFWGVLYPQWTSTLE
ncbi:C1 family peptidase [Novipirellula maiorica]|nr:C1 family peptidase [Rhodopirellula maiorica]